MRIIKGSITALASEGRATLQVPEICIGTGIEFEELPDDWFITLSSNDLPSKQGFLFLTKKGFEANKEALKEAYEKAGGIWSYFEKAAADEFDRRRQRASWEIAKLRKKISSLEGYYRKELMQ